MFKKNTSCKQYPSFELNLSLCLCMFSECNGSFVTIFQLCCCLLKRLEGTCELYGYVFMHSGTAENIVRCDCTWSYTDMYNCYTDMYIL